MDDLSHEFFMKKVLTLAKDAEIRQEVPIAAIIVAGNKILSTAVNSVKFLNDATAHAEMIAISAACNYLNSRYLKGCTLYVNLEPCQMCMAASFWAHINLVVYGAPDKRFKGTTKICQPKTLSGVLENQSTQIINDFFKKIRK